MNIITILEKPGLWQLYTLSAFFLLGSITMYGPLTDPCLLVTGKSVCKEGAEIFVSRSIAIGLLYVGTFYFTLTHINKDDAPKLKRLANMGTMCVTALLASIIFIGPSNQGGLENSMLHFIDLISGFILLAIMISAIGDGSNMAAPSSPLKGHGINPKTFLFFLTVVVFLKLVFMSELTDPSLFLVNRGSVTAFSRELWKFMIAIMLMILFPIIFALGYGNYKDQEAIAGVTVIMMIASLISYFPIRDQLVKGIMTMAPISGGVIFLFAITTIFFGRSSRPDENETIINEKTEPEETV